MRDYVDAGVIIAVVLINAIIGFTQEMRAREAIRGLARLSAPRAEVTREGRVHIRESRDLVPGDIVLLATGTLAVFWWTLDRTGDVTHARTLAMTQMVVFQFYHVFNCRSLDRSVFHMDPFSNRFLFVSIVAAALAHLAVLHVAFLQGVFRTGPLSGTEWLVVLAIGSFVIFGGELDKLRNRRKQTLLG